MATKSKNYCYYCNIETEEQVKLPWLCSKCNEDIKQAIIDGKKARALKDIKKRVPKKP